eukprot:403350317
MSQDNNKVDMNQSQNQPTEEDQLQEQAQSQDQQLYYNQQQQLQQQMRSQQNPNFQWTKHNLNPNQQRQMIQNSQSQYFLPNINLSKRKPWNPRFHVSSLSNLAKSHPFYRGYFDKNERVNDRKLLKPTHPEKSMREIIQTQQTQMMRRSTSQQSLQNWDGYFSKMHSKNNEKVHTNFREFFDKPIVYDAKGYSGNINFGPMEVYNRLSPKGKQISRKTSSDFYKSQPAERFLKTNKSNSLKSSVEENGGEVELKNWFAHLQVQ